MMLTLESFIERGYLPYELIPPLTTINLSKVLPEIIPQLDYFIGKNPKSNYCTYSIPKVKHLRRTLAIPNPLHQIKLCQVLHNNWHEIDEYISKSTLSLSKPLIEYIKLFGSVHENERTFKRKINLSEIPIYRSLYSTTARYLLKSDISRFYPTIYTHSIPWVLHTKKKAKKMQRDLSLIGNSIDTYIRKCQDNQTIGIPIGPDSSLLISEIIGTSIDINLVERLKKRKIALKGFRFVDDFYLYFKNLSDAENALAELQKITKDLELELNNDKTKIIELPESLEAKWILELRSNKLQDFNEKRQTDDLINYFSKAFDLSKKYPDESVLKYALTEISDVYIDKPDWTLYESLILKSMISEPSVLPIATEILISYKVKRFPLNMIKIKNTLYEIISYHSKYNHSHEVTWALWLCKSLKIKVNNSIAKEISKMEDSVVALVALDLLNNKLINKLDTDLWLQYMTPDELYSNHWLLAYEALKKGWLIPRKNKNYINNDPFFKLLKENDIEFYDSTRQVNHIELTKGKISKKIQQSREKRKRRIRGY